MKTQQGALRAALWIGPYMVLVLAPLGLALLDSPPASRGFWVEFGVGLGFVGLAMLSMQFLLTARFQRIATLYGQDAMLQFHRQAGIAAAIFVIAHPVILFLADPTYTAFLDPRVNLPRFLALTFVIVALALLIVLSLWRKRIGISYE